MSSPSAKDKIHCLVHRYFPWGQPGYPVQPQDPSPGDLEGLVGTWVQSRIGSLKFDTTALALHARIQAVIDEVEGALPFGDRPRHFYRSDLGHLVKSPDSILDKMVRDWDANGSGGPRMSFDNFVDEMDDLARFRVVLNFLSDVDAVCSTLEIPYTCTPADQCRLSRAQRALYGEFALRHNRMDDLIGQKPETRKSGERCRKGVFFRRDEPRVKVEVQIQTMLQEAWDKKDHFLVYEPKRRGDPVEDKHRIEIYAMSELLYVADLTFDRLLRDIRPRPVGAI